MSPVPPGITPASSVVPPLRTKSPMAAGMTTAAARATPGSAGSTRWLANSPMRAVSGGRRCPAMREFSRSRSRAAASASSFLSGRVPRRSPRRLDRVSTEMSSAACLRSCQATPRDSVAFLRSLQSIWILSLAKT